MIFQNNKVGPVQFQITQSQFIAKNIQHAHKGICRICLQEDIGLIKPCACIGTMQMVHQKCMKKWISVRYTKQLNMNLQCEICLQKIHFQLTTIYSWNPSKFLQNLQKINPIHTTILFIFLFSVIILSILLKFGRNDLLEGQGLIIVISFLTITIVGLIVIVFYIFFLLLTDKSYTIQKLYSKQQVSNQVNQRLPTSFTSMVSQNI